MESILFEHNQKAYVAAAKMMAQTGKAAVIHPTGTGKSFIAFQLCADNAESKIAWLSPSEYIFETQGEKWRAAGGAELKNVRFITYARLMRMGEDELADIEPDYIVLDEFHRCGAAQWGGGVKRLREQYPKAKILGLSATNIRYLDNQRDMAWELFDGNIASELTLGAAVACGILPAPKYVLSVYAYQMELRRYEAKVQQAKSKAVRDTAEKELEALRRALEKADGLAEVFARHMEVGETKAGKAKKGYGKYIVFCANYGHLLEMRDLAEEWFAKVDAAPHIFTAYSDDPATSAEFEAFKSDTSAHLKLLYCIDMLNEGVHVDGIDGVILLRPTVSPTIYKQQIGRALAAGGEKTPVIFDIVMNIENLCSIGAIEEELHEAVSACRVGGRGDEVVQEHFRIVDELGDCRKLFAQLNETLGASWEAMYAMAKEYYAEHRNLEIPKRYTTAEGYSLGAWLDTQRKVYAGKVAGNLSGEQIKKLSAIGMRWKGTRMLAWEKHYAEAVQYYEEHGNLLVGLDGQPPEERYAALGRWLAKMRLERKKEEVLRTAAMVGSAKSDYENLLSARLPRGKDEKCPDKKEWADAERVLMGKPGNGYTGRAGLLNAEKIAALDALGMVWDDADYVWEQHFAAAERYYRAHGDLEVASYYVDVDGFLLGKWIIKQRRLWKEKRGMAELPDTKGGHRYSEGKSKNTLTEEQIARLSEIGMLWQGRRHTLWEKSYAAACEYYREHGNLEVPATFVTADGCRLGRWIRGQRNAYQNAVQEHELPKGSRKKTRTQILDAERIKRLEQIGMVWESEDSWEHRFALANKYYREHGNLNLPADYVKDGIWLGRWLREQKARLRAEAVQEPGEEKDICSPEKLESEICEQNRKSSGEFFTPQQREKLYSLGLKGAASQAELAWRRQYGEAEEFYREHGNLAIPKRYIGKSGKSLGVWLQHQRTNRRSGQLTGEQVALLDRIGMVWNPDAPWKVGLQHARKYFQEMGHLAVPNNYVCADGYRLGKWISNQRCAYRGALGRGLEAEQIRQLEEIGMVWSAKPGRHGAKICVK